MTDLWFFKGKISFQWVNPLWELTLTRVREFVREPEAVFWVFVFPVLLAMVLGIAFRNTGTEQVFVAIEIQSQEESRLASNQMMEWLSQDPNIHAIQLPPKEISRALQSGRVSLVVSTRTEGSSSSQKDALGKLVYQYDASQLKSRTARLIVDDVLQRSMGRKNVTQVIDKRFDQSGSRYIDFLIPGLVGLNLMGSGMWGLGFAVVQARTRKLMKLFVATPMRKTHFLFSFIFSRLLFLILEVIVVISFGWVIFDVSVRGSVLTVGLISLVGSLTFAGLGLLVAARPVTIEGVSGLMNLVMLPMWLLSGTFFSSEKFPDLMQPVIQALPLTALNNALRGVINEGLPLNSHLPELGIMLIWASISFLIALRWFRWQ